MSDVDTLKKIVKTLKIDVLNSIYNVKTGHIGGSFSAAEIITVLYFHVLNIDPKNPHMINRDRFVLSKGHSAPILYAALARKGFFPLDDLNHLRMVNSHLQGAPNINTPGIDMSSGPLGQGLSAAVGMALNARISKLDYKVWCMVGDGEVQEGQIWEAAMTAGKYLLNNLICILDHNKVQMSGTSNEMMPVGDVGKKLETFGWRSVYISDGNCIEEILDTFNNLWKEEDSRPIAIIAETVKSKGVSFMEGKWMWHGAITSKDLYEQALNELKGAE